MKATAVYFIAIMMFFMVAAGAVIQDQVVFLIGFLGLVFLGIMGFDEFLIEQEGKDNEQS